MKVVFLGTSGTVPTVERGMPSVAVEHNGEIFLFDCGEGTQRQMMRFKVNISRIKAIFLTHMHGDHILGVPGLLRTLSMNGRTSELEIYAPEGGRKVLEDMISLDKWGISYKITIKQMRAGTVYKGRDFQIDAFKLLHNIATFGLVFRENDKTRFIKRKIAKLDIKGKTFGELLKRKSIRLNNRTIKLKDITETSSGRKIVYATDTRPAAATSKAALDADLLIHESSYSEKHSDKAKERFHSTAAECARIAKSARAKRLVLVHPSARYKDISILLAESRKVFRNTEFAKDGMVIQL